MCRWLAYCGPEVRLSSLVTRPRHSLIDQSIHARENVVTANGDGFGLGWYGGEPRPGCYHSTRPAWNDSNLRHLAAHIHSGLFLAHVRATTGSPVQQTNCHPFAFENWLFQHNGSIDGFARIHRRLLFDVDPNLFPHVRGSTDSEVLFLLAQTFGLSSDPSAGIARAVAHVESVQRRSGLEPRVWISAAVTDGSRLFAVRYSTDGDSPSLYHSSHLDSLRSVHGDYDPLQEGAVVVVSEPLDSLKDHWQAVDESSLLVVEDGRVTASRFVPIVAA